MKEPTEDVFRSILVGEQATDDQIEELEIAGLMLLEGVPASIYRYYERSTPDGLTLQFVTELQEQNPGAPAEVTMNILTDDLVEPRFALSYNERNDLFYVGMSDDDTPTIIAELVDRLIQEGDLSGYEKAILNFFSGRLRSEEEIDEGSLNSELLHPSLGVFHVADLMRRLVESNSTYFVRVRECNFRTASGKEVLAVSNQACNGVPEEDLDDFPVLQLYVDDMRDRYSYAFTLEQSGERSFSVHEIAVLQREGLTCDDEGEIAKFRRDLFGETMSSEDVAFLIGALAEERTTAEEDT